MGVVLPEAGGLERQRTGTPVNLDELIDNRADPEARLVLEDVLLERGIRTTRLGGVLWLASLYAAITTGAGADTGVAYTGVEADHADDNGNGDDADDDDDGNDATADADAADQATADAAGAAGAEGASDLGTDLENRSALKALLWKEPDMQNGLKIIQVPGRYGTWAVTRVGWLRRVNGDEWELLPGARTILRTGAPRPLDSLASNGPLDDHRLTEPSGATEEIHRLLIRRSIAADERAWGEACPRPADWNSNGPERL